MLNSLSYIFKNIFLETLWEVLYFPVWWYSRGFKKTAYFSFRKIKIGWRASGLWSFARNFLRPMYGSKGWDAYAISVVVRVFQMSWRFLILIAWSLFWLFTIIIWCLLPIFLIWQLGIYG